MMESSTKFSEAVLTNLSALGIESIDVEPIKHGMNRSETLFGEFCARIAHANSSMALGFYIVRVYR